MPANLLAIREDGEELRRHDQDSVHPTLSTPVLWMTVFRHSLAAGGGRQGRLRAGRDRRGEALRLGRVDLRGEGQRDRHGNRNEGGPEVVLAKLKAELPRFVPLAVY